MDIPFNLPLVDCLKNDFIGVSLLVIIHENACDVLRYLAKNSSQILYRFKFLIVEFEEAILGKTVQ